MQYVELDTERILASSEQWLHLEKKWGQPVDLDAEGSLHPGSSKSAGLHKSMEQSVFDGPRKHNLKADTSIEETGEERSPNSGVAMQSGGLWDSSVSSSNLSFEDGEGYSADVESVSELQMSATDKRVNCKRGVKDEEIDIERYQWMKSTDL